VKFRTFYCYSDPGHAWVKVPKAFLVQIIGEHWRKAFTCFSYERGDNVYLEEDEDACRFVKACQAVGIQPMFKQSSANISRRSRIRGYASLSPI
jgi:hypothetical protein